jgi:hypothetical protein
MPDLIVWAMCQHFSVHVQGAQAEGVQVLPVNHITCPHVTGGQANDARKIDDERCVRSSVAMASSHNHIQQQDLSLDKLEMVVVVVF